MRWSLGGVHHAPQIIPLRVLPKQSNSCLIARILKKHRRMATLALPMMFWVISGHARVPSQPALAAPAPTLPSSSTAPGASEPGGSTAAQDDTTAPSNASAPSAPSDAGASSDNRRQLVQAAQSQPAPPATPPAPSGGITLLDGSLVPGRVVEQKPGAYAIVERPDGKREAVEWSQIRSIDGAPPPPVPPPGEGSLIPDNFSPEQIEKLQQNGKAFSETAKGLFAPKDGKVLIGSITQAQDLLEQAGLKRGPPNGFSIGYSMLMLPLCFEMTRGTLGRVDGTGGFGVGCTYVIAPISVILLVLAPFNVMGESETPEMTGPSVHHIDASIYALDYSKKSALTGSFAREPSGGFLGNNLGYDLAYTYIHRKFGVIGYGAATLQQTSISSTRYLEVSSSFFKADVQTGLDVIRLLSGGDPSSFWSQHVAYLRGGPSFFHNWILSRDVGTPGAGAAVDNPLNNSVPLVTGLGYELAAEVDLRFPYSLGGVHFKFERGTYPSLSFPELNARDGAFVALIGFDDLRAGDTYTWQRLKLELELPIGYSRSGGLYLGGQLARYENNFGSGVDNRGLSLDYRFRFQ